MYILIVYFDLDFDFDDLGRPRLPFLTQSAGTLLLEFFGLYDFLYTLPLGQLSF